MAEAGALKQVYEIPGVVEWSAGNGGLPKVTLKAGDSIAEVYLNGACVTRYDVAGKPVLFCSKTSKYENGKAIRGGVPVIFPWFGPHPSDPRLPQHGFARAMEWEVEAAHAENGSMAYVVLSLASNDYTRGVWPYDFALKYTVWIEDSLEISLQVTNTGTSPFAFEEALHSYLSVADVRSISITGLEDTLYVDKVDGGATKQQGKDPLVLSGETDRVFLDTENACTVHDPMSGKTKVSKEGSKSTVVWNPWETKAEGMADMAGGQWPLFVCVETANAMQNAVTLQPGETHALSAWIQRE